MSKEQLRILHTSHVSVPHYNYSYINVAHFNTLSNLDLPFQKLLSHPNRNQNSFRSAVFVRVKARAALRLCRMLQISLITFRKRRYYSVTRSISVYTYLHFEFRNAHLAPKIAQLQSTGNSHSVFSQQTATSHTLQSRTFPQTCTRTLWFSDDGYT